MKNLRMVLAVAAALGAGALMSGTAQAAPAGLAAHLNAVGVELNVVEKTQYYFGGRRYCFYEDGWNGPGWYWCGYRLRRGLGFGGGHGWHNWHYHSGPKKNWNPPKKNPPPKNWKKKHP